MPVVTIRPARPSDAAALGRMRAALWPDGTASHHEEEVAETIAGRAATSTPLVNIVAESGNGTIVGFVEVGLRSHANGCDPGQPVGFIEGWYVLEHYRRKGIGRRLITAAEDWARHHGCREMASDTPIENESSQRAHEALGYAVVDTCVNYRKTL
jgi:aminoglycoside 6'-N-acetyltransferase I